MTPQSIELDGQEVVVYNTGMTFPQVINWAYTEIGVTAFMMIDVMMRLVCYPSGQVASLVFNFYGIVDIMVYSCVVLPNLMPAEQVAKVCASKTSLQVRRIGDCDHRVLALWVARRLESRTVRS